MTSIKVVDKVVLDLLVTKDGVVVVKIKMEIAFEVLRTGSVWVVIVCFV